MSIFSQKKPEPKRDDHFESTDSASQEQEARAVPLEISPYDNELLLRGRIGVSAGGSAPEEAKNEKKEAPKDKETKHYDIIETEYAQIMKIHINNNFETVEE